MPTKRRPAPKRRKGGYKGYTASEQDLLRFSQWVLMVAFIFLVIAAIITTSQKLMYYSVIVGVFIAYGIYKGWFEP